MLSSGSDHANCGSCGFNCKNQDNVNSSNTNCDSGKCDFNCDFGYEDCDNQDANGCEAELAADFDNCGACGNWCGGRGTECVNGRCRCEAYEGDPPADYACPWGFWCKDEGDLYLFCHCRDDAACVEYSGKAKCCPANYGGDIKYECCDACFGGCVDIQEEVDIETDCQDAADNDGDSDTDCEDLDCQFFWDCG